MEIAASIFPPFDSPAGLRVPAIARGILPDSLFDAHLQQENVNKMFNLAQDSESMADFRAKRRAAAE